MITLNSVLAEYHISTTLRASMPLRSHSLFADDSEPFAIKIIGQEKL